MKRKNDGEGSGKNLEDFQSPPSKQLPRFQEDDTLTEDSVSVKELDSASCLLLDDDNDDDENDALEVWKQMQLHNAHMDNEGNSNSGTFVDMRSLEDAYLKIYEMFRNQGGIIESIAIDSAIEKQGLSSGPEGHSPSCKVSSMLPGSTPKSNSEFFNCAQSVAIVTKGICTCKDAKD